MNVDPGIAMQLFEYLIDLQPTERTFPAAKQLKKTTISTKSTIDDSLSYDGFPDVDENCRDFKDIMEFKTDFETIYCPNLKGKSKKKTMSECLARMKKSNQEQFDKGSFTIQPVYRISLTNFSSIFSGSKSKETDQGKSYKKYEIIVYLVLIYDTNQK